jgi:CheY-like chemotaxis protein
MYKPGGEPDVEPPTRRPAGGNTKTILIAEDEAHLRELVRAVLGPGYRYGEAADGVEALEQLRTLKPDLVLLDLMLPQASGLDVLDAIRADPEFAETGVVILTAWAHFQYEARLAGADRFLLKPFEPTELQDVVREVLGGGS